MHNIPMYATYIICIPHFDMLYSLVSFAYNKLDSFKLGTGLARAWFIEIVSQIPFVCVFVCYMSVCVFVCVCACPPLRA